MQDLTPESSFKTPESSFPQGHGREEQNRDGGTHFHLQLHTIPGANPGFSPRVEPYQP